jgi:hypothetical protein
MKKLVSVILFVFWIITATPVCGAEHPQGNFVMAGGKYRMMDEADPFEKIDKTFFSSIIIPVKDGAINFTTSQPIDSETGNQKFSGNIEFRISGSYDKETGAISANFNQSSDYFYERKTDSGTREGKGGSVFVGTAKGTVIDNQIVLSFEGKLSDKATSEADDKSVDSSSASGQPWTKKVVFGTSEWVEQVEVEETQEESTAKDSGARVSDLSGQVEIACPPNLDTWDVMKMGRVIYVDCHLKTGEDSKAVISFSDMTTFVMKPESEITIDTPPEKDSKLKLLAGNIWANVKKMAKDGTMEVHMGQAVAGIKGTTFVLEENGETSTLKVIDGVVAFKSKVTNDEKMVNSGEMLTATKTGLTEVQKFDIDGEKTKWEEKEEVEINDNDNKTTSKKYFWVAIMAIVGIGGFVLLKNKHQNL